MATNDGRITLSDKRESDYRRLAGVVGVGAGRRPWAGDMTGAMTRLLEHVSDDDPLRRRLWGARGV